MSLDELDRSFSLEGISGGNAVFNTEKLDWMNGQYIARLAIDRLADAVAPFFLEAGLGRAGVRLRGSTGCSICCVRERSGLTDFVDLARPFLADTVEYEAEAIEKHLRVAGPGCTCRGARRRTAGDGSLR